ncbi:MAG: DUF5329 domain-containing protein [Methylobacteriaceae bacterium]|nr:DUF5329 domain-containing protein [Methylobacteriaceae bacterium]
MGDAFCNLKAIFFASVAGLVCVAVAQARPVSGLEEARQLVTVVEQSDCQFERGGVWYTARDAAEHLRGKLASSEKRLKSGESVIQYASGAGSAAKSANRVRCQDETADAKDWFTRKLAELREAE